MVLWSAPTRWQRAAWGLGLALVTGVQAQSPSRPTTTLTAHAELVSVPVIVRDKSGAHIHGLKKEDFTLAEEGKEQQIGLCLDHLRKRQTRKEDPQMVMDSSGQPVDVLERVSDDRAGANPERDLMRRELGAKINQALTKLTPRERMVFELKHYQGLRLRTIGEMLNTTEETAKNTLFRATQKLRGALGPMR